MVDLVLVDQHCCEEWSNMVKHQEVLASYHAEERVLNITYYPLAVFRVRPVTRCTSSLSGHIEVHIDLIFRCFADPILVKDKIS